MLLFDRMPSRYRLSGAGAEVFETAEAMESLASRFEARIAGRDQAASGSLRPGTAPVALGRPPGIVAADLRVVADQLLHG